MSILICNGTIVNENSQIQADIFVRRDRIERIDQNLSSVNAERVVDASGLYIFPGMIDDQVHFREPGLTHKATIHTESRAAVAGGITSYMEMPNTKPPTVTTNALEDKFQRASVCSLANYSFYFGGTNENLEIIKSLDPALACGVKLFMGSSTGNMLVDNPVILEAIFAASPLLIATHCEDTPTILENEKDYRERYGEDIEAHLHPEIRSREACYKSTELAVGLARKHGAKLHVLHITTAEELALFEVGSMSSKKVTAEACVHHLHFSDADYATKGHLIKCNPAIKTSSDRQALHKAIHDDRIDIIATDHAPHTIDEKNNTYFNAPSGLPLVQHSMNVLIDLYHQDVLSLEQIVRKTAHAPAKRFQLHQRGFVREGYFADLVLVDLASKTNVDAEPVYSKCGWTPFGGHTFHSRIKTTIVSGHVAFHDGTFDESVLGQKLTFDRRM